MSNDSLDEQKQNRTIGGAAVAGGVTGLVVGGPILGVVGAVGTGVLATQQNKCGDVARATGDVVLAAGDRAKKFNEKHHVLEKTKTAAEKVVETAKKFDEKHHVVDKTTNGLKNIAEKIRPKSKK